MGRTDHSFRLKVRTLFAVVDDVLAEQVVVAEHHRGAQGGEVLLHPHHLLLQHRLARNLLLDSGRGAQMEKGQMFHVTHTNAHTHTLVSSFGWL